MKIGDKVKILEPREWPNHLWADGMLSLVGTTGTVMKMDIEHPVVGVEIDDEDRTLYWFFLEDLEVIRELPILEYTPSSTKSSLAKNLFYDSATLMAFENKEAAHEYYFAKMEEEFKYWFKNLSIIQVYSKGD